MPTMLTALMVLALAQVAPDRIAAAITHGLTVKQPTYIQMGGKEAPHHTIIVTGPFGRIATAAAEASRRYASFTSDNVTPDLSANTLTVEVMSGEPRRYQAPAMGWQWQFAEEPTHVVVRFADGRAVQPTATEPMTRTWPNRNSGEELRASGIRASFDLNAIPPDANVIVVVLTKSASREYPIKAKDLAKVR